MKYAYIDGDDIGLKIEKSLITNDEPGLRSVNQAVTEAIQQLTKGLSALGCEVIFSGADGIILKAEELKVESLQSTILAAQSAFRFSVGIGDSLQEAFVALRYAKSNGKNGVAVFKSVFTWFKTPIQIKEAEQGDGEERR